MFTEAQVHHLKRLIFEKHRRGYYLQSYQAICYLPRQCLLVFQDSKKISDAKITKDYESVLKDFERAQLLAAEKEKAFPHPIANNTRQLR